MTLKQALAYSCRLFAGLGTIVLTLLAVAAILGALMGIFIGIVWLVVTWVPGGFHGALRYTAFGIYAILCAWLVLILAWDVGEYVCPLWKRRSPH